MVELLDQAALRVRGDELPAALSHEATLRLMAREVAAFLQMPDGAESLADDAWQRELAEPTYIGMGLAVPHARVSGLEQPALYMAYSRGGIPWPHEEAHFIALLVVPLESPELHLQLLARLVRWRRQLTEAEACALAESPDKLEDSLRADP